MENRVETAFLDSRDKYLSFVTATDEKVRVAFCLARVLERMTLPPAGAPFFALDAGTGEGTVAATFLAAVHKRMPQKPVVFVGKEISVDDVCILLNYLPDRFAEHKQLVFHVTNLSYAELADPAAAGAVHVKRALRGTTSHEFGMQLMTMAPFVKEHWALDVRAGRMTPRRKVILTLYRRDQTEFMTPLLIPPARFELIIASQAFRLRRAPESVAQGVVAPLLRLLGSGGRMGLVYSSGRDFSREVLRRLYPEVDPYRFAAPGTLLVAARQLPELAGVRTRVGALRYGFINLYVGRSAFSLGNVMSLWKAVTYVGQLSDAETAAAPLDARMEAELTAMLAGREDLFFENNVILFSRPQSSTIEPAEGRSVLK